MEPALAPPFNKARTRSRVAAALQRCDTEAFARHYYCTHIFMLLLANAAAAWQAPAAARHRAGRRCYRSSADAPIICLAAAQGSPDDEQALLPPPIGLRCLSRREVLDKLNAVPVFAIANDRDELISTQGSGAKPTCTYYLELADARAALAELQEADPRASVQLTMAPLGTAFALSEWQEIVDEEASEPLISAEVAAAFEDDDEDEDSASDALAANDGYDRSPEGAALSATAQAAFMADLEAQRDAGSGGAALRSGVSGRGDGGGGDTATWRTFAPEGLDVLLHSSQSEVACVGEDALAASPAPPLLRRRNVRTGPIPLFGSDRLKVRPPPEEAKEEEEEEAEAAAAAKGSSMMSDGALTPLFFRRSDFYAAWEASGGDVAALPPVQLTDLRTLAYQMQFDATQDYRCMVLVAPENSIRLLQRQEAMLATRRAGGGREDAASQPPPALSREDLQGLLLETPPSND